MENEFNLVDMVDEKREEDSKTKEVKREQIISEYEDLLGY